MATTTTRLLTDPTELAARFADACAWCAHFALCTPALDSELGAWSSWRAVETYGSKLTYAVVALDAMVSEPHALAWLQGQGVLRLVPAADGSFRAHVYRFERDGLARIFIGSGALVRPGLMESFDAVLFWEGPARTSFAMEVERMFQKARLRAHVPTQAELDEYTRAYFEGAGLREQLAILGARFIRTAARDADVSELELVVDAAEVRRSMRLVRGQLMLASTERRRQAVGFRGGNVTTTIHWCAPLKTWSLFQRLGNRYWNCFGTSRPDKNKALPIVVEVNPPLEGMNRQMGGAFARDPSSGDVYFVHRGRIGGGQRGIGAELFWSRFRGGVAMRELGRDQRARVVVVGKVGAPEFARGVAGFVHEVGRIKGATAG